MSLNLTKRKIIANNIKNKLNMDIITLSKKSDLDISVIDKIISCRKDATRKEIEQIAKALNCLYNDLVRFDKDLWHKL